MQSPDLCAHGPAMLASKVPLALPETCQPLHLVPTALLRGSREGASGSAENCRALRSWHHSPLRHRIDQESHAAVRDCGSASKELHGCAGTRGPSCPPCRCPPASLSFVLPPLRKWHWAGMSGQDSARPVAAVEPAVLQEKPRGHKGLGSPAGSWLLGPVGCRFRAQVSAAGSGESSSLLTSRK